MNEWFQVIIVEEVWSLWMCTWILFSTCFIYPTVAKSSRIKICTSRFIISEKRLISSILICLVMHRMIGWRGLFEVPIDHGRLPQYSRMSFPQPQENDVDWLRENTYFNILYYSLFPSGIRIYLLLQIQLKSFS